MPNCLNDLDYLVIVWDHVNVGGLVHLVLTWWNRKAWVTRKEYSINWEAYFTLYHIGVLGKLRYNASCAPYVRLGIIVGALQYNFRRPIPTRANIWRQPSRFRLEVSHLFGLSIQVFWGENSFDSAAPETGTLFCIVWCFNSWAHNKTWRQIF